MTDEFPTKREVLDGFTLSGPLDLSGNEIYGLPDVPNTDNSAASKKYVDSKITLSGGTMTDDINMNGNDITHLQDMPPTDNSAVCKKYVDNKVSNITHPGLTQAQADNRYMRKTKITLGEWMDTFDDVNFIAYNWSPHVRKSMLMSDSNIEIKVASFVTDMSISNPISFSN